MTAPSQSLFARLQELDTIIGDLERDYNRIGTKIRELVQERDKICNTLQKRPRVSDHAIIQYLENILGLDLWSQQLRFKVLPDDADLIKQIQKEGDGRYSVGESHVIILRKNEVIGIITS